MRRLAIPVLLALVVTAGAHAYSIDGRGWPGGTIRYFNAAHDQAWAVNRAITAWNASGAELRFVPAPETQAQVVIRDLDGSDCHPHETTVGGRATVGYGRGATVWLSHLDASSPKCNAYASAQVAAHELGHVLGLGHEQRGCATMNPSGTYRGPSRCVGPPWTWDCGLLHRDDIDGAVRLYGGVVREPRVHTCDLYAPPAPPSAVRLSAGAEAGSVVVSFARPSDAALPSFLDPGRASYAVQTQRGSCPTVGDHAARYAWGVPVGGVQRTQVDGLGPGTWCVAVWSFDGLGRSSTRPATAAIRML